MRNLTEWFEVRADPTREKRRLFVLRCVELLPLTLLLLLMGLGLGFALIEGGLRWEAGNKGSATNWGLVFLGVCVVAPVALRPLTTPGVSVQRRYAVGALLVGAHVAWFVFLAENMGRRFEDPSKMGILLILALVGFAGFLRLGWSEATR